LAAGPRPACGGARDPRRHARPVPARVLMLTARVAVRLGTLDLDVAVDAAPGEIVALLGPNGAGKTTFLRAVAGLVALDRGRVELDDVVLEDASRGFRVRRNAGRSAWSSRTTCCFPISPRSRAWRSACARAGPRRPR